MRSNNWSKYRIQRLRSLADKLKTSNKSLLERGKRLAKEEKKTRNAIRSSVFSPTVQLGIECHHISGLGRLG